MSPAPMRLDGLALALVLSVSTQTVFARNSPAQDAEKQATDVSDRPTFIPSKPTSISFDLRDNLVVVNTIVNGKGQFAVLDSGSSTVLFDSRLAEAHGLERGESIGDIAGAGP